MSQEPTKKVLTVEERLAEFQNWLSLEDPGFISIRDRVSKMMLDFAAQESKPLVEAIADFLAIEEKHNGPLYLGNGKQLEAALTAHRIKYPEVKS